MNRPGLGLEPRTSGLNSQHHTTEPGPFPWLKSSPKTILQIMFLALILKICWENQRMSSIVVSMGHWLQTLSGCHGNNANIDNEGVVGWRPCGDLLVAACGARACAGEKYDLYSQPSRTSSKYAAPVNATRYSETIQIGISNLLFPWSDPLLKLTGNQMANYHTHFVREIGDLLCHSCRPAMPIFSMC